MRLPPDAGVGDRRDCRAHGARSQACATKMTGRPLKMYSELARWWPLVSPPSHCIEEAPDVRAMLRPAFDAPPRTLLELGSARIDPESRDVFIAHRRQAGPA
jgi:hypothetical protein